MFPVLRDDNYLPILPSRRHKWTPFWKEQKDFASFSSTLGAQTLSKTHQEPGPGKLCKIGPTGNLSYNRQG